MLPEGDQFNEHHLPFSESIDSIEGQSAVSIGYASFTPNKYITRAGVKTLTVNSDGVCSQLDSFTLLVPELSWFTDYLLPDVNLLQIMGTHTHFVGPTGLFVIASQLSAGAEVSFSDSSEKFSEQVS